MDPSKFASEVGVETVSPQADEEDIIRWSSAYSYIMSQSWGGAAPEELTVETKSLLKYLLFYKVPATVSGVHIL